MHNHETCAPAHLCQPGTFGERLHFEVTSPSDIALPVDPYASTKRWGHAAVLDQLRRLVIVLDSDLANTQCHREHTVQAQWKAVVDASFHWELPDMDGPAHEPTQPNLVATNVSAGMRGERFGGDESVSSYVETQMFRAEDLAEWARRAARSTTSLASGTTQALSTSQSTFSAIYGTHEVDVWLYARRGDVCRSWPALAAEIKYITATDGPARRREVHAAAHEQCMMYLGAQHELAGTSLSMTIVNHRFSRGFILPSLPHILQASVIWSGSEAGVDRDTACSSPLTPLPESLPSPGSFPLYLLEVSTDWIARPAGKGDSGSPPRMRLSRLGDLFDRPDIEAALAHDLAALGQAGWRQSVPLLTAFRAVYSHLSIALQMISKLPTGTSAPPRNLPPLPKAFTDRCEELCGRLVSEMSPAELQYLGTRRRSHSDRTPASHSDSPSRDARSASAREAQSRRERRHAQIGERSARYIERAERHVEGPPTVSPPKATLRPMGSSPPPTLRPSPVQPAANVQSSSEQPVIAPPSPISGPSRSSNATTTSDPSLEVPRGQDVPGRSPSSYGSRRLRDLRLEELSEKEETDMLIDFEPQPEDAIPVLPWIDTSSSGFDVRPVDFAASDASDSVASDFDMDDDAGWDAWSLEDPRCVVPEWVREQVVLLVDASTMDELSQLILESDPE